MTAIHIPEVESIAEFMQGLLGLETTAASDCPTGLHSVAEYRNDSDELLAFISCDLTSACRLGAALTQVPTARVEEVIATGEIPATLLENLDEIFNIGANLISKPDNGRVQFSKSSHGNIPEEISETLKNSDSTEYCFEIMRYGNCRIMISACA